MNKELSNKSIRKNPHFDLGTFTHGDFSRIAKMTGLHYQTVRKTLLYGRRNETVLEAAARISSVNKQLKLA